MTKQIRRIFSTIAIILCVSIGLTLPTEVFASTLPKDNTVYSSFDDVQGETEEVGNIIAELTDERTETSKEFLLDDGTKMIVNYGTPVHYQDDKDNWVEYNNSLKAENSTSTADEASVGEYTNKSSDIDVKLSNKAKVNNMIRVSSDDYSISWGYDDVNKSKIKIINKNEKLEGNEKFTTLKNLTSEAKYENVYDNVDLQYFVTSTGVKENIILNSSDVQNEFNLTYKIKNLIAEQTDDYTITLFNKKNEEVYKIVAPYMTDADGKTSTQLKLEIVSQKGGNLKVKLTADYWFIHSLGRSFPITIDPEVTLSGYSNIETAEVLDAQLDTVRGQSTHFNVGKTTSSGTYSGLVKLKNLEDYADKNIVSAKINIYPMYSSSEMEIKAYQITSSWTNSTATYNNVTYDNEVIDYANTKSGSSENVSFDITKYVKKWAAGTIDNNGVYLKSDDSYTDFGGYACYFADRKPTFVVIYKDYTGMENNLSYHTISVGQNAQASVSDYLGNLVINQSLYEGTGSRMPAHITATYNSVLHNKLFANGSPAGYGWQFSFNQYVEETDSSLKSAGYDYIYTDEDGTEHYFKKDDPADTEQWTDEDNLGLTLTADDNYVYISNGDVIQKYDSPSNKGVLLSETDSNNNVITYTYNSLGNLTKITDGSGREIKINYAYYSGNSEPRVKSIDLPDGNNIGFAYYANQLLACVGFPDGKYSWFYYTEYTTDGLLNKVEQRDCSGSEDVRGQKYGFTYNDSNQVTCVKEYGSNNTVGNYLNIAYGDDNTTVFTDRQGRSETHTFNNSGETISVLNANGYLSSGSNELLISSGADSFTKNYITESTEQTEIKSDGYYFKSNGDRNGTVSSGGTAVIDTSAPSEENRQVQYFGSTSIKINNPVSDSNSAFFTGAAHQFNTTELNGKTVTFSAYVKTKDVKEIYSGGSVGAILKIKCFDSSGNSVKEVNSIGIDGTQDWQRFSVTADIPETTIYFRVYCMVRYASGTAWFDCLQLEEGECANNFNALQNGNFESKDYWLTEENKAISVENGTVTIIGTAGAYENAEEVGESTDSEEEEIQPATYYETVTETAPNDSITTYDDYGNVIKTEQGFVTRTIKKTYEVKSTEPASEESTENPTDSSEDSGESSDKPDNSLGNKYIYQNVNVDRTGIMFNIVGEAQAKSVPLSNENRTFGIALNIYYKGNPIPETHYQEFNAATSHKHTVSMSVIPDDTSTEIDYVAFAFVYGNNENTMTAYTAMLNIASTGYSIDDSSETSDATDETDDEDNWIDYEVISESVDKSKAYMQTSSVYDSTSNYVASESDEAGNTISYTYDANGNITSVTDGNNNVVNYTYNSNNDTTSISSNGAENQYSYSSTNSISAITHNSFCYTFNYDVFNNLISSKVGDTALVSNTYSANNGNLTKTTYANGDYIQYTYDKYDNITKLTTETGVISEFVYNKKGLVAKAVDNSSSTTTYYYYDFNGNLTGEYRQTDGGDLSYFLSYDENGNKIEITSINGQTKTITTGTDEDGKSYVSNEGVTSKTTTDDFGRTTQIKTSRGEGNSVYFSEYEYAEGSAENSTTNLVGKLTQRYRADELVNYKYSYDKNGNITQIYEDGTLAHKYTYDSLNQLKEEYDYVNLFYISYSYDNSGNINAKHEQSLHPTYLYPTGSEKGNVYYYNDTEWKDKLTKINSYDITYDESGNPLSYRDGMTMSWKNGRQLASLQTADNDVNYRYDSNGMRTQKTDNSGTTYYYYDSNKNLIGLTKGNDTLLFYYDTDGNITSFKYGDTMYYYVKNLQGDVVKIIDQAGTVYASYIYDAWGNVKSVSGEPILRELNPFRYRGYVYDNESGLYYLQSRYYDPFTGRFINADVYFDTQSGSPLSTNMFAYCKNNAIFYVDPTGYWNTSDHKTMTNNQGFSGDKYKTVRDWVYNADAYPCESTKDYSAPFHGRSNALDIGRKLYNLALEVKKSKSKVKFYWSGREASKNNGKSLDFLTYNTKKGGSSKKTNEAMNSLRKKLNDANNSSKQSQMLLGLALHTLQDFFAHVVQAKLYKYDISYNWVNKRTTITGYGWMYMYKVDDTMGVSNSVIEDNKSVFKWRYETASALTKSIYSNFWSKNKKMSKLWVTQASKADIYNKVTFNIGISRIEWRIECKRYYYHWSY